DRTRRDRLDELAGPQPDLGVVGGVGSLPQRLQGRVPQRIQCRARLFAPVELIVAELPDEEGYFVALPLSVGLALQKADLRRERQAQRRTHQRAGSHVLLHEGWSPAPQCSPLAPRADAGTHSRSEWTTLGGGAGSAATVCAADRNASPENRQD